MFPLSDWVLLSSFFFRQMFLDGTRLVLLRPLALRCTTIRLEMRFTLLDPSLGRVASLNTASLTRGAPKTFLPVS
jgi:hypothetical protein